MFSKGAALGATMLASALLVAPGSGRASESIDRLAAKGLCSEMSDIINTLADFSQTQCLPAQSSNGMDFVFVTEKPVFAVESAKKIWLLAMMAAVGFILNDNPEYQAGTISVTDVPTLAKKTYYSISAQTLKELQGKLKRNELDLTGAWNKLSAELKPASL